MFNEDVLEEFNKANPGKEVSLLDVEHLEKPIALKIINGRVMQTSLVKLDSITLIFPTRLKPFLSAKTNPFGQSTLSVVLSLNFNCSSMVHLVCSINKIWKATTRKTPFTT